MNYQTIDIRDLKETGMPLKVAIVNAVKDTQLLGVRDLPDRLVMTKTQFKALMDEPESQAMLNTKDRLWLTPLNCMEIEVK